MDPQNVKTVAIVMSCLVVCVAAWMTVRTWRGVQHDRAARRVRDRLDQEADPEGWSRRQAHQAREAALIAAELAAMRRASWYGRLRRWWRQTDESQV